MTGPSPDSAKLASVIARVSRDHRPARRCPEGCFAESEPGCALLIYSFLLWESSPRLAAPALARLGEGMIDCNDLRVALPSEIAEVAGLRDGIALERAERLRACLNDLFQREHAVSLRRLAELSKREVRDFLDTLEGIPAFVAARVTLLGFGGHAVPTDARLVGLLAGEGVFAPPLPDPAEAERWLERQIRAGDAEPAVLALETWRDAARKPRIRKGRPARPARAKERKPEKGS